MSVQFSITTANVASLIAQGYTKLEIWVSIDLANSYQEITSSTALPATLTSLPANTLYDMNGGKLLKFSINGAPEVSVTFNGNFVRYWSPTQVATQINLSAAGVASVVNNSVILSSITTGRVSTLLITYNDATELGFTETQMGIGLDSRVTLAGGTVIYSYIDMAGSTAYKYKWRYSANGVNPISDFSEPIYGNTVPFAVPVSIGTATFVGIDGRPQKRTIIIGLDDVPFVTSGFAVGNELVQTYTADNNGFIQVPLIRGARVKIALEGTSYVREIIVPNTSTFDLLAAMSVVTDPFTIQVPPPFLIRRGP